MTAVMGAGGCHGTSQGPGAQGEVETLPSLSLPTVKQALDWGSCQMLMGSIVLLCPAPQDAWWTLSSAVFPSAPWCSQQKFAAPTVGSAACSLSQLSVSLSLSL